MKMRSNYAPIIIPVFCVFLIVFTVSCSDDSLVAGPPTDAFAMSEESVVFKSVLNSQSRDLLVGEGSAYAKEPHVASTPNGYLVVWRDWRGGDGGNSYARSVFVSGSFTCADRLLRVVGQSRICIVH